MRQNQQPKRFMRWGQPTAQDESVVEAIEQPGAPLEAALEPLEKRDAMPPKTLATPGLHVRQYANALTGFEAQSRILKGTIPYGIPTARKNSKGYREMIAPGAFAQGLKEFEVLALINDSVEHILGRVNNRTLKLDDSPSALRFQLELPETTFGNNVVVLVGNKTVTDAGPAYWVEKASIRGDLYVIEKATMAHISIIFGHTGIGAVTLYTAAEMEAACDQARASAQLPNAQILSELDRKRLSSREPFKRVSPVKEFIH